MNIEKFSAAINLAQESFEKYGFNSQMGITEENNSAVVVYEGERGTITITYNNEKISAVNEEGKRIVYALLPEDANDKDVKFVAGELAGTLDDKFGVKKPSNKKSSAKMPQTVSKAAVKNGSSYDASTLASKICLVFPELREEYKANVDTYGEFLAEDFFVNHGTPKIINAIKENKPATMKKMFQILNEMFEDGTNALQSLIAVTIMGELNNDQILLARCVDYMSETMAPPVIEVNKFLATAKGKKAKKKLENPPAYKPPKAKKPGLMEKMMGAQQQQGLNNK